MTIISPVKIGAPPDQLQRAIARCCLRLGRASDDPRRASFRPYDPVSISRKVAQKSRRQDPKVAQRGERHKIKFSPPIITPMVAAIIVAIP
jgi:hypothetical protein